MIPIFFFLVNPIRYQVEYVNHDITFHVTEASKITWVVLTLLISYISDSCILSRGIIIHVVYNNTDDKV